MDRRVLRRLPITSLLILVVGAFDKLAVDERAPARTRATKWGALTIRHRVWADSISLNAIATPAARLPGPLVTRVRSRTVAKVDSKLSCQAAVKRG